MRWLERQWYLPSYTLETFLLLPLAGLFQLAVSIRRFLYRRGILKTVYVNAPVIVVGNITVGGTGKTPFVLWLAAYLKQQGYRPGIVTRGVGGQVQHVPYRVEKNADPSKVGDEALVLVNRSFCPVMVGVDRVAAVQTLLQTTDCNVIISDDGLQHYRMGRQIEIALIDGERRLGNKTFLPSGPLRESAKRLQSVDCIVVQQGDVNDRFTMQLRGDTLVSLVDPHRTLPLTHFRHQTVHALAGIGNPDRFFTLLRHEQVDIVPHIFPDHASYCKKDILFKDALPVVMTEKDAVKCLSFADERHWYLPVTAHLTHAFEDEMNNLMRSL